tara:strand:+ start:7958 stop:9136 length:1179 start_codon:yes stop_codon:yes gene_type:complete
MEDGGLFEGLGADFLAGGTEDASFEDSPGFDPITGEIFGDDVKKEVEPGAEPDLQKEIKFVTDEEDTEAEDNDTASGDNNNEEIDEDTLDSEESTSSPLTSLTSALREDGVLSSLSEEDLSKIKTAGDLMDAVKNQIKDNEYSGLNDNQKEYLKAMELGVPEEAYKEAKRSASQLAKIDVSTLEGEDESAATFRKQVLVQDFLSKGFDQEDSEKYAGRSIDLGEDIEDSKKAFKRLQEGEAKRAGEMVTNAEADRATAQEGYNKKVNELKAKVNSTNEILPNVKINAATQGKIFDTMTKTAGYDKNNNAVNAVVKSMVEDQEYLIKLNYLHVLTDGLSDFSTLTGTVGKSAVTKLEQSLARQDAKLKSGHSESGGGTKKGAAGILSAIDGLL